ncbi:MAG: ABC transporter ATP-binding protein [Acidobacteria bacterium]|nr:ABC transporter ATP-binding protein [Acidobacteriota bacterium]
MQPLFRLFRYAAPYRGRLAAAFVAMLFYAAGSAALAYLIKPIIDKVLPSREDLQITAMAIIAAYVCKGLGSYFSEYLMADVGQRVVTDLRNLLYHHVLDQSATFFKQRTTGQLMSRLTNDVGQVQRAVSETIADLIRESVALAGYAALLFYYDYGLALVCMTGAPLVLYPLVRLGQRLRRTTRLSQEALEHMSHVSAEAFTGHRIVKAFGAETREAERFGRAAFRLYRANMRVTRVLSILPPLMELLGGVGIVAALWYGSREIVSGRLTTGDFASFVAALFLMYGPAKKLSRVNASIQQAVASSERIFELLDTHSEVIEAPDAIELRKPPDAIEFRHVRFGYDDARHRPILKDVTLTVQAGQMIAIVGQSGAGKTTLVNLLPRFYDVTDGAILIDGVDIRRVTLKSLRSQIGLVTQETVLFDDTVANNIAYAAPGASIVEIEAAARAAHAHEFISAMPNGYASKIAERGQRLSGGQRQRLAIARALLRNAPILILDEATSSLDTESELLVQDALANLMLNRTSFVIAHRLSTVRRADLIIVLEAGEIVEMGRHDELLARPEGAYARLHALQLLGMKRDEVTPAR